MFSQQGDHLHPNLANCETSYPITVERKTDWPIPLSSVAGSALPTYPANPVYPVYQPLYNFPARSLPPPHIYPASGLPATTPFSLLMISITLSTTKDITNNHPKLSALYSVRL